MLRTRFRKHTGGDKAGTVHHVFAHIFISALLAILQDQFIGSSLRLDTVIRMIPVPETTAWNIVVLRTFTDCIRIIVVHDQWVPCFPLSHSDFLRAT